MGVITTLDELINYVEANTLSDFTVIKPSLRTAERRHLVPVLGDEQYQELLDAYNEQPQALSADEQRLLDLSQEAVANIAMAVATSRIAVQLSDAGVRRSESENLKTAYQYQEVNLRESFAQAGFDALEDILKFLEIKKEVFTAWAQSAAYLDYRAYFIPSGMDFNRYYANKQSRLMYLHIRHIMKPVENLVKDVIGKSLFDFLKAGQKANNLTESYKLLLEDYICPAVALHTIARALLQNAVDVNENGVTVSLLGITKNSQERQPAPAAKAEAMSVSLAADADDFLKRLKTELIGNPDTYPEYVAPAEQSGLINIINKQENGFFGA